MCGFSLDLIWSAKNKVNTFFPPAAWTSFWNGRFTLIHVIRTPSIKKETSLCGFYQGAVVVTYSSKLGDQWRHGGMNTILPDHCVQVPWKYIKVCGYSDPFCKNLNQRALTPRWPLTPTSVEVTCVTLPKDHCVQVPWEYIKVCEYNDQFCKWPKVIDP